MYVWGGERGGSAGMLVPINREYRRKKTKSPFHCISTVGQPIDLYVFRISALVTY